MTLNLSFKLGGNSSSLASAQLISALQSHPNTTKPHNEERMTWSCVTTHKQSCIKYTVCVGVCGLVLPCPGGVIVMVCAVNSSSKYRVSISEVTWGLNGGTSCWRHKHISTSVPSVSLITVVLLMTIYIFSRCWHFKWRNHIDPWAKLLLSELGVLSETMISRNRATWTFWKLTFFS